jgi:putative transposase
MELPGQISTEIDTEVIQRRRPWRSVDEMEFATLECAHRFNSQRLLRPIGNIHPAEAEARYYARTAEHARAV